MDVVFFSSFIFNDGWEYMAESDLSLCAFPTGESLILGTMNPPQIQILLFEFPKKQDS